MKKQKLSTKKLYLGSSFIMLILSLAFIIFLYERTKSGIVVLGALSYLLGVCGLVYLLLLQIRKKIELFNTELGKTLDRMMNGEDRFLAALEEETILSKVSHQLMRLYGVMEENRSRAEKEKKDLQELVSDISHQVKTPIANLKMVNATLLEKELPQEEQQEFLHAVENQLEKLDFLMQSMVKSSRLETGVITLNERSESIYGTIAKALGGILISAGKKNIEVKVECDSEIIVYHDRKWTEEAIFNILDNGVKYTDAGGKIHVKVEQLELYTRIDITDNGRGIPEGSYPKIFKRFYREEEVHDIEGIGIGLYLARTIVSRQGGYIKVTSQERKGSTFSILLLNHAPV